VHRGRAAWLVAAAGAVALLWTVVVAPRAGERAAPPLAGAAVGAPGAALSSSPAAAPSPGLFFRRGWVAVPVATVWIRPGTARPVDAAEVSPAPDIAAWLSHLDQATRLGLDDLVATQALLYEPLVVIGVSGPWAHVVVTDQTGSAFPLGIGGWMPSSQLRYGRPPAAPGYATVAVATLRAGPEVVSYGTRLPVESEGAGTAVVELPSGPARVAAAALRVVSPPRTAAALIAEARRFLGLPYLWAGTSGFGFDCSGLTYRVFRQFGVVLPRDAADQALGGRPVARADLRPGDLVFFSFGGPIDHVGIYAGGGRLIDAPHTGAVVEEIPLWSGPLAPYYAGARRYL
jgi:cell wall-associated NlpC family hydrolase